MFSKHGKTKIVIITAIVVLMIIFSYFSYTLFIPSKVTLSPGTDITVDDDDGADYNSIQDAINAAKDGDTIFVYSGTYLENVVVDKRINLIGEEKDITIIDGQKNSDVVYINASGVEVNSFTIQHAGSTISPKRDAGIDISPQCSNVTIKNCKIVNCNTGIYLHGISSINNRFIDCSISDHWVGFYIDGSSKNEIISCVVSNNEHCGVWLISSSNNTISKCIFSYNGRGVWFLVSSNYNEITKCIFANNGLGITIGYYFTIGGDSGGSSQENRIYLNNFIDNEKQARDRWANHWDNGSEGNYWSDYVGEDANGDGVGDTAYNIDFGRDNYPFMEPLILDLPEEEEPVEKFAVQPIMIIVIIVIIIISMAAVGITYGKKGRKQKEKISQEYISKEIEPIMVKCPYCNTSFQITPTKKPFKAKCPNCNKVSLLR